MNQKQIYEVLYKPLYGGKETSCYGICLDRNHLLLEDLSLILIKEQKISVPILRSIAPARLPNIASALRNGNSSLLNLQQIALQSPNANSLSTFEVEVAEDVPGPIKKALEEAYEVANKMLEAEEKLNEILAQYCEEQKALTEQIKNVPEICRNARGTITEGEFVEAFIDNLSDDMRHAMERADYTIEMSPTGQINIRRDVEIEPWAKPSYSYLEYDGTRFLDRSSEAYDTDLKKYSSPLPVGTKIRESLNLGDKDWLYYVGEYEIPLEASRELTKEYAKELAMAFCGISRTLEEEEGKEDGPSID